MQPSSPSPFCRYPAYSDKERSSVAIAKTSNNGLPPSKQAKKKRSLSARHLAIFPPQLSRSLVRSQAQRKWHLRSSRWVINPAASYSCETQSLTGIKN